MARDRNKAPRARRPRAPAASPFGGPARMASSFAAMARDLALGDVAGMGLALAGGMVKFLRDAGEDDAAIRRVFEAAMASRPKENLPC